MFPLSWSQFNYIDHKQDLVWARLALAYMGNRSGSSMLLILYLRQFVNMAMCQKVPVLYDSPLQATSSYLSHENKYPTNLFSQQTKVYHLFSLSLL